MNSEDEYRLSFYKEIGELSTAKNVKIVRDLRTSAICVRKELTEYDLSVFKLLSKKHYEGIPRVYDFAEDPENGKFTVIEEFIPGKTLRGILDFKGTLPEDQAVSVVTALCSVIKPLHRHKPPIIHRDIKPENIILTDDANLYLVDFDASKTYSGGKERDTQLIGTRKYAAPEQYGYAQSDQRTDIYAIGKVGREMITGDPNKTTSMLSDEMAAIFNKCTSMDPDNRYNNVQELEDAVTQLYITPAVSDEKITKKTKRALHRIVESTSIRKFLSSLMDSH